MSNIRVSFYSGASIIGTNYYYNWDDVMSTVNSLRDSNTFYIWCQNLAETEFQLIEESDTTITLTRKNYVNNEFAGYVTVESGLTTMLAAIDRVNLIYTNGSSWHHDQIEALSICTQALVGCI